MILISINLKYKLKQMIRKLERKDKENWIKLYCGYAKFYKVSMNNEILNTLWRLDT